MSTAVTKTMGQVSELENSYHEALRAGRFLDAARLARALNRRSDAAEHFLKAGEPFEAAVAYRESGQASRALAAALELSHGDPCYRAAARLVIDLAAALRLVRQDVDDFLVPYLAASPASREDCDAFFLLGQLYELYEYTNLSLSLYRRVAYVDPRHAAAVELSRAELRAQQNATTEVLVSLDDMREVRELMMLPVNDKKPAARIRPGALVAGRYRVERLIGTGSTAAVFRAHDTQLEEYVALKAFDPVSKDAHQEARFRREVSLARRLAHPNIVRLYDIVEHEGSRFITMELLDGTDLRTFMEPGSSATLALKRELMIQACEGLGYAHQNNVVHRDIKPENLFVTSAKKLKVADFGIAKGFGDASITMTGSMGGTPYYMSPEQITDFRNVDYRTDLYALGVVAYELFTGKVPFHADGLTQLLLLHLEASPASMRSLVPDLPKELDDIVLRLLAKSPDQRPRTCAEVADALGKVEL